MLEPNQHPWNYVSHNEDVTMDSVSNAVKPLLLADISLHFGDLGPLKVRPN